MNMGNMDMDMDMNMDMGMGHGHGHGHGTWDPAGLVEMCMFVCGLIGVFLGLTGIWPGHCTVFGRY